MSRASGDSTTAVLGCVTALIASPFLAVVSALYRGWAATILWNSKRVYVHAKKSGWLI